MKTVVSCAALLVLLACAGDRRAAEPETDSAEPELAFTTAPPPPPPVKTCTPGPDRLCRVDEGADDPEFADYRQELMIALNGNDATELARFVDPAVRTSFGGTGGFADFMASWQTTGLRDILSSGGSFRGEGKDRMFWAPYVYSNWPESVDAFRHVAAIRADVPVRATAADGAAVVETVDWAILELLPRNDPFPAEWLEVRTPSGKRGWVDSDDVFSPVGYRAGFSKRSGEWKLEALVAGD